MCFCGSSSASPRRLNELTRAGYLASRTLAANSPYFAGDRQVPVPELPVRRYVSHGSAKATDRYFVDKLPVYVTTDSEALSASAVVHFAYIDEGAETLQGFGTFLEQYGALFAALKVFEVVYVATTSVWFEKAERMFGRAAGNPTQYPTPLTPDELELLDYFQVRRKFEARDFAGLDTDRIIRYREEKRRFADTAHEELYRCWLTDGEHALRRIPSSEMVRGSFRTMLIPHDYDILGGMERAS